MQGGHPDNSEAGSQRARSGGHRARGPARGPPAGAPHAGGSSCCAGFRPCVTKPGSDLDAAVSTDRLFRWLWLGLVCRFCEDIDLNAGDNRRGRPHESGGPPPFALSLKIQRDIAHGSGLPLALSVIGIHGMSKENASAEQPEKCRRNHRIHPYATLCRCSDRTTSASCPALLTRVSKVASRGRTCAQFEAARIRTPSCCIQGTQGRAARASVLPPRNQEGHSMSGDPNIPRAIEEAAGYVRDTIKHFTDDERRQILDRALGELGSRLAVRDGS